MASPVTITKFELMQAMSYKGAYTWYDSQGKQHYGLLRFIAPEDGSGKSFNVTLLLAQAELKHETFHIRTID